MSECKNSPLSLKFLQLLKQQIERVKLRLLHRIFSNLQNFFFIELFHPRVCSRYSVIQSRECVVKISEINRLSLQMLQRCL